MISSLSWVPRGAFNPEPVRNELSPDELDALVNQSEGMTLGDEGDEGDDDAKLSDDEDEGEDEEETKDAGSTPAMDGDEDEEAMLKELGMEGYDEEEEAGAEIFLGGKNLTVHADNADDPYITVPDDADASDDEDLALSDKDAIILVGKTEEEHSMLEVHVLSEADSNLYVHHDFALPSFPLCTAFVDLNPKTGERGSFVAVGTFQPGIELWNLDVLDVLEPTLTLGGRLPPDHDKVVALRAKCKKNKKFKKKLKAALLGDFAPNSHADAVMCLAWHPSHRGRLASGSADGTIKLWDLITGECTATLTHHTSKVQTLEWNPAEPSLLLSGAFDRTLSLVDIRNPTGVQTISVDADLEVVKWSPAHPFMFLAGTESGTVTCHDARKLQKKLFTLSAHNKPCTAISWNTVAAPPMFATASIDGTVKLWEIINDKPSLICTRAMGIGAIFSMSFDLKAGSPFMLAAGGDEGKIGVWDTMENESVDRRYGKLGFGTRETNMSK